MELDDIYQIILLVIFILVPLVKRLLAGKEEGDASASERQAEHPIEDETDWDDWDWDQEFPDEAADSAAASGTAQDSEWRDDELRDDELGSARLPPGQLIHAEDPYAEERRQAVAQFDEFIAKADAFLVHHRIERSTRPIAEAIADYVLPRARRSRKELAEQKETLAIESLSRLHHLQAVFAAAEVLVRQRHLPEIRDALGDADAVAQACYQPILDFARVNLPALTSAQPVSVLTPFSLSIWTGFIPTGLAPLFLPQTFFSDLRWWPALAHEIGHDFLAATGNAEAELRQQLGLPDEQIGQKLLAFDSDGLHPSELFRVFGAFFEEIFCDVFGTMMLGPAYGYTAVELFADPDMPSRTITVATDMSGRRYELHPPQTLRVEVIARTLELMGEDGSAHEIRQQWNELHGEQDAIVFPVRGGALGIPLEAMNAISGALVERLYSDRLDGLDGHSLSDIPGLEYGTHRAAEAGRASDELLAGRTPSEHRPRAVVAGAVLAWHRNRDRHDQILALARRAIVGVRETRPDHYSESQDRSGLAAPITKMRSKAELREAFILHTLLSPPPSLAGVRPRTPSFLARRTWP